MHLPFKGPIGVVGNEERLENNLRKNFTRLVTESVHILSDPLVTVMKLCSEFHSLSLFLSSFSPFSFPFHPLSITYTSFDHHLLSVSLFLPPSPTLLSHSLPFTLHPPMSPSSSPRTH